MALCFLWGSTYLFIKIGIDYWPPVLLAGARNLLAFAAVTLVLVAAAVVWRRPRPLPGKPRRGGDRGTPGLPAAPGWPPALTRR
ncbi:MAG: hypothetical protein ACJ73E_12655 [Mycobacteriales bacterium]